MTTLADYTSPGLIISGLRSREFAAVIGALCGRLQREGRLAEALPFYNAALSHELVSSTATAPGWALPHARVPGAAELSFAVGRSPTALIWPGAEAVPVRVAFLFVIPESEGAGYLGLVAGMARLSRDPALCARLLDAPDSQAIFEVLQQVRLRQSHPATTHTPSII